MSNSLDKFYREWWSNFNFGAFFDINVDFTNQINSPGSFLPLNTGALFNKAVATSSSNVWYIRVRKRNNYSTGMQFQLEYGGQITRCIGVDAAAYGALTSLQALLFELPLLKELGTLVSIVSDSPEIRVYRIRIIYPGNYPLNLYFETDGLCNVQAGPSIVSISTGDTATYRYRVQSGASIILKATSVIPAGTHTIDVTADNMLSVSPWGVERDSFTLGLFDSDENVLYERAMSSTGILRTTYSSLHFSSGIPGDPTAVSVVICLDQFIRSGDVFRISLANFADTGGDFNFISPGNSKITWHSSLKELSIKSLDPTNSSMCVVEYVTLSRGLLLPSMIISESSYRFTFSVTTASGIISGSQFETQSSVGFSYTSLIVADRRAGFNTTITLVLNLACPISGDAIVLILPGFKKTSVTLDIITLRGPFQHALSRGIWRESSSQLWISPNATILPGEYTIVIEADQGMAIAPQGQNAFSAPRITLSQSGTVVPSVVFTEYQKVLGFMNSSLLMKVDRPSNKLFSLSFQANLGPAIDSYLEVSIKLPCLTSSTNYLHWDMGAGDSLYWDGVNKMLVYIAVNGLQGGNVRIDLSDTQSLYINSEVGVPHITSSVHYNLNKESTGVYVSVVGKDDGVLDPWPLLNVTVVPVIVSTQLSLLTTNGGSNILNIKIQLNMNASTLDTLWLKIPSYSGLLRNMTVSGLCSNAQTIRYVQSKSAIKLTLDPTCSKGIAHINWNISNPMYKIYPTQVNQVNSDSDMHVAWDNAFLNTGFIPIIEVPIVGFASTALAFSVPTSRVISDMEFKAILITELEQGDFISLSLPNFSFPFSKSVITGNINRIWNLEWCVRVIIFNISINILYFNYIAMFLGQVIQVF
jgi:hypothetical protein